VIGSLKNLNSTGCDEITTRLLKLCIPYVISPLTYICNSVLNTGVFADRLKYATVTPIHKKGDIYSMSNYRPICILIAFSNIFERIIYTRIINHIHSNNILTHYQFGFRKHYSMDQVIFLFINSVLNAMNEHQVAAGMFCDLHKAYDSVNHQILLKKLQFYGISVKMQTLIRSYLTDRYQRVICENKFSPWKTIQCGLPQGSILGPLLFLIYINNFPFITNAKNNTMYYMLMILILSLQSLVMQTSSIKTYHFLTL
jgi:hypothetical protein